MTVLACSCCTVQGLNYLMIPSNMSSECIAGFKISVREDAREEIMKGPGTFVQKSDHNWNMESSVAGSVLLHGDLSAPCAGTRHCS